MESLRIEAFAKLNLGLRILGVREDGYHDIDSTFQSISLSDELTFVKRAEGISVVTSPDIGVPALDNLVWRAAQLARETGGVDGGIAIQLKKRIPVGAGMGGGSSDAAATLVAMNKLFHLDLSIQQLHELGAQLGSDVPFFLNGGRSQVSGRGEILEPLEVVKEPIHVAILHPPFSLRTPEVFARYDEFADAERTKLELGLENDLEPAALALRPELVETRRFLEASKARSFGLTGSGPTYYAIDSDKDIIARIAVEAEHELHCMSQICIYVNSGYEILN